LYHGKVNGRKNTLNLVKVSISEESFFFVQPTYNLENAKKAICKASRGQKVKV